MNELIKALGKRYTLSSINASKAESTRSVWQGMFDHDASEWERVRMDRDIPPAIRQVFHQRMQASARRLKSAIRNVETAGAIVAIDHKLFHEAKEQWDLSQTADAFGRALEV